MNKLPLKIIVDGKVLVINNDVPDVFKINIADGVYTAAYGEVVTITITVLTEDNGDYQYYIDDTDNGSYTTAIPIVADTVGTVTTIILTIESHVLFGIESV